MSKAMESLVIQTRTARCGKCYKIDLDGVFRGNSYCDEEIVKEFNAYSGNCFLIPRNTVEDQLTRMVEKCWEETLTIVHLLAMNMKNVISVSGHQLLQNAKNKNKKWIVVKTKKSVYWLVFDRMYMDDVGDGQTVHTIYGLLQFFRDIDTAHKPEGPNSVLTSETRYRYKTWKLFYPHKWRDDVAMDRWLSCNFKEVEYRCYGWKEEYRLIHEAKAYNPNLSVVSEPYKIGKCFMEFVCMNEK